jgi:hypothetical protein
MSDTIDDKAKEAAHFLQSLARLFERLSQRVKDGTWPDQKAPELLQKLATSCRQEADDVLHYLDMEARGAQFL